ncbi:hypothetical protein NMD64_07050 [Edwardsiella tarda]
MGRYIVTFDNTGRPVTKHASVNNLFDTQYYYSEGFIEEERNYWTGIAYTF